MMNSVALALLAGQEKEAPAAEVDLSRLLSDVEDLVYSTEMLGRANREEVRTIQGPDEFLAARCIGATITGIAADLTRVEHAEARQLRREALELFAAVSRGPSWPSQRR